MTDISTVTKPMKGHEDMCAELIRAIEGVKDKKSVYIVACVNDYSLDDPKLGEAQVYAHGDQKVLMYLTNAVLRAVREKIQ